MLRSGISLALSAARLRHLAPTDQAAHYRRAWPAYRFDHALLNSGWARDVRVDVADGAIARVTPDAPPDGAQHVSGFAIPGMPNLHCHAFQRGMAGLAEQRGPAHDSFWTWREVMYRFLGKLTPDDAEAIAAFAYMQMLETGFTAVGEFHYLHHDLDGRPYADLGEMATRIAAAAHANRHRTDAAPRSLYLRRLRRRGAERGPEALSQRSGPLRGAGRAHPRDREDAARRARRHRATFAACRHAGGVAQRRRGAWRRPDPHSCRRADQGSRGLHRGAEGNARHVAARQCRRRSALVSHSRHAHDRRRDAAPRGLRRGGRFVSAHRSLAR